MARKRMMLSRVKPGMIVAEDILTAEGKLIIPDGTVLNDEIIEKLKQYSVFAVYIEDERDREAKPSGEKDAKAPSSEEGYLTKLKKSQEFQVFQKDYMHTVSALEGALKSLAEGDKEIQQDNLLKGVEDVLDKTNNALDLLDMLHCMRDYDDLTYIHSLNVGILSNMIGREVIKNITDEELNVLTLAGMLHDIGKLMIPEAVLQKKEPLTEQEYRMVKTHTLHGYTILKGLDIDSRIAQVAMCHHERCDGSGYPGGRGLDKIPVFARIVSIADVYDAMTCERVYREGVSPFEVIAMFEREGVWKFDAEFLLPFLNKVVLSCLNSEVRLSNNEVGKVVMINQGALSRPVVQIGNDFKDLSSFKNISIDKIII